MDVEALDLRPWQTVVLRSTEHYLDGPPRPDEAELVYLEEDYADERRRLYYKLCEHCEEAVPRWKSHVWAK